MNVGRIYICISLSFTLQITHSFLVAIKNCIIVMKSIYKLVLHDFKMEVFLYTFFFFLILFAFIYLLLNNVYKLCFRWRASEG